MLFYLLSTNFSLPSYTYRFSLCHFFVLLCLPWEYPGKNGGQANTAHTITFQKLSTLSARNTCLLIPQTHNFPTTKLEDISLRPWKHLKGNGDTMATPTHQPATCRLQGYEVLLLYFPPFLNGRENQIRKQLQKQNSIITVHS